MAEHPQQRARAQSDVVALFDTDHKLVADLANWHRPGSSRYVEVAGTEHGKTKVGDRFEVREKTIAGGKPPSGKLNPQVAEAVATWVKESMANPPGRTVAEHAVAASGASWEPLAWAGAPTTLRDMIMLQRVVLL